MKTVFLEYIKSLLARPPSTYEVSEFKKREGRKNLYDFQGKPIDGASLSAFLKDIKKAMKRQLPSSAVVACKWNLDQDAEDQEIRISQKSNIDKIKKAWRNKYFSTSKNIRVPEKQPSANKKQSR